MADLFQEARAGGKAPSLHSDTEIYRAVNKLGAYLMRRISNLERGMKAILGVALLFEAAEMAELVRQANIARGADKLPLLDDLLGRLERVRYLLRNANEAEILPHRAYAESIPLTDSISKQAYGLKKEFRAPAPSPAT